MSPADLGILAIQENRELRALLLRKGLRAPSEKATSELQNRPEFEKENRLRIFWGRFLEKFHKILELF